MADLLRLLVLLHFFLMSCLAGAWDIPSLNWVVQETSYTRLCRAKKILTVNGGFPGPTLHVRKGDRLFINVHNQGRYNITIHWHGVKQPRNPWSDGPNYITQCPIKPGASFRYEVIFSTEEGTLWWHAHSDWSRATVHGPIFIYPKYEETYPFPQPHAEFPVLLASWYKGDVMEIIRTALANGGETNKSDGFTINGQPGDLYQCSKQGTRKFMVDYGKTYLLRLINSIMNEEMFFMIANHALTVVGMDGTYLKPFKTNYVMITPGQTMDLLVEASQPPSHYYMAARAYGGVTYDNTTTTAVFQYNGKYIAPSKPAFPALPNYTDINAATNFTSKLRSFLASDKHSVNVPKKIDKRFTIVISLNALPCPNASCAGPNGSRLAASANNISFVDPSVDVLLAYFKRIRGQYTTDFPSEPLYKYNYTGDEFPDNVLISQPGTRARILEYNSSVEIVFQGTNVLSGAENHPMHLHGFSFYVVGSGFGIFNSKTHPQTYNLVDPPEMNTVGVPKNGWVAIRLRADNPGVWFFHCHLERHTSWGMDGVLIVKNGKTLLTSMRGPPGYLNPC